MDQYEHEPGLLRELKTALGDGLRAVAEYDRHGYEVLYLRPDVEERLTDTAIQRIHDDLVLQGVSKSHLEALFQVGELQVTVHRFEEPSVFHFLESESDGLYVALDADCTLEFHEFLDTCAEYI